MKLDLKIIKIEITAEVPQYVKRWMCRNIGHKYVFIKGYGGYCVRCRQLHPTIKD